MTLYLHNFLPPGAVVRRPAIIFNQCGDPKFTLEHYKRDPPIIKSQTIIFDRCHKEFIRFVALEVSKPLLMDTYVNSHPYSSDVMDALCKQSCRKLYLHEDFVKKWRKIVGGVFPSSFEIIKHKDYNTLLDKLLHELEYDLLASS